MKIDQATEKIIESAKKEFLEFGYANASLRNIARNAGVTTGSLYSRFSNKDDLFSSLVEPITDMFFSLFDKGSCKSYADADLSSVWDNSRNGMMDLVDYIYEHKEAFDLLVNCSVGSSQENFIELLIEKEEEQLVNFVPRLIEAGYACKSLSKNEIHTLVSSNYYAMFEIVRHDTTKKQAVAQLTVVADFFKAGWCSILGI